MNTTIPAECMKNTIGYLYLLSYCPPDKVADFKNSADPLLSQLAAKAGMEKGPYLRRALPEACHRMVAFHQASREPDLALVQALLKSAASADTDADSLAAFKSQVALLSALPGRAKTENRLHRKKGCRLCAEPCRYGFFTLVSEPDMSRLQDFFTVESRKPAFSQTPLLPVYLFTINHLLTLTAAQNSIFERTHVANLAFCLLLLGLAKSRMAFPEEQIRLFQEANQEFLRRQGGRWACG